MLGYLIWFFPQLPENIKRIATSEPRTNSNVNYKFPDQKLHRDNFKHKLNGLTYQNVETLTQKKCKPKAQLSFASF